MTLQDLHGLLQLKVESGHCLRETSAPGTSDGEKPQIADNPQRSSVVSQPWKPWYSRQLLTGPGASLSWSVAVVQQDSME